MENEMVERVADVIWPLTDWNGDREEAVAAARAAIQAMRDRNEPMLDAGTAVLWPHAKHLMPGSTAVAVWEAMIDAALKEP